MPMQCYDNSNARLQFGSVSLPNGKKWNVYATSRLTHTCEVAGLR